jgi:hypothetical protein
VQEAKSKCDTFSIFLAIASERACGIDEEGNIGVGWAGYPVVRSEIRFRDRCWF